MGSSIFHFPLSFINLHAPFSMLPSFKTDENSTTAFAPLIFTSSILISLMPLLSFLASSVTSLSPLKTSAKLFPEARTSLSNLIFVLSESNSKNSLASPFSTALRNLITTFSGVSALKKKIYPLLQHR